MIYRRIFLGMMVVPLLIFGVNAGVRGASTMGSFTAKNLPRTNFSLGRYINPISSWDRGDPQEWKIAARGELTEDCLLYGICADGEDDNDQGENDNNS